MTITYWCSRCGETAQYPDCGTMEVYIRCRRCSEYHPVLFFKKRLQAIMCLDDQRRALTVRLAKLIGASFEEMVSNPGKTIGDYVTAQERKENENP
jgi:DNA-directed RNA polymerase subunit RPC12/RpoP